MANQAIPESENHRQLLEQQKLIQASLDGFLMVRVLDGRIIEANDAFCRMVGYSREELLAMHLSELEADESPEETAARIKKIMAVGCDRFETRHRHKQGHLIDFEISASHSELDGGINYAFVRDITARKRTEDALYFIAQRGWMDGAETFLTALARYLGVTLGTDYVVIDRLDGNPGIAETVALYAEGEIVPNLHYVLKGTPCDNVMGRKFCFYPQGIQQLFPDDTLLVEMGAESYAGIPLWDSAGQPIGLIAVMHRKPLSDEGTILRLLQLVAIRAAAELERERSDRLLREREQEFRCLAENSPDSIIRYDRDGRMRYLNPGLLRFLGVSATDVIGGLPREVWPDGRYSEIDRARARAMETGETTIAEFCQADATGASRFHQIHVVPERDAAGQLIGTIAFGREVTDIREAERKLRHFFENLPGMAYTFRLSPGGHAAFPFTSPAIEKLFGLKPEDVKDDMAPLHNLLHPGDRPHLDAAAAESVRTMMPFSAEARVCRPGQPERWLDMHSVPEREADGSTLWHGIMLDITERKQAEEALRVSEERLRLFFERQVAGMAITSPEKGWIQVNDKICEILGYPGEELARLTWAELTHPDDLAADAAQFERMLGGEIDSYTLEKRFVRKDGSIVFTNLAVGCVRRADRSVDYVLALLEDITERKRAERARHAHARALECMDRINKALQGTTDLEQMMHDVLDVVLAVFDCDRAFMIFPCDPDAAEWRVSMERTRLEYPGAFALGRGAIPMDKEAARILRITLGAAGPVTFGQGGEYPIPPNISGHFGFKSQMLMALHPKLDKRWAFGIHQCSHAKGWTEDETELFQRIGWRLSDGLTSLLMYRNLRTSEQKFRTLAENLPANLASYDRNFRRTYVNPVLERDYGVTAEQLLGKTLGETNPTNLPVVETYQRALEHTFATGEHCEFEFEMPTPSGDTHTTVIITAPERAADGQISGVIAIGRDITERKRAEQQLRKVSAHLQTVREEEKTHLAREIHDDLGSILFALKIETHLLNSGLSADQKRMPLFSRVESMVALLDDALNATRRIVTDLRPTVLDDRGLMAALEWHTEQFHKHTGIECRIACIFRESNSCTGCKDCEYALDKTLSVTLFRILQESLNNVARHSGASRVEIELQPGDCEVVLSISDNGRGIPGGHTIASTSYGIRGMRERVEQLGGTLELAEPLGGGLSVIVKLPLSAASQHV